MSPTMRFIKIILCCWMVFTNHFSNGRTIHGLEIKTRLINHTMELIDKSFTNNSNPVIIISDLVDDQVLIRNDDNRNPLIVVNRDLKIKEIEEYLPSYPTYVFTLKFLQKQMSVVFEFMHSTIRITKSPMFIIDTFEWSGAVNARSILHILSNFDILVAYYLCYDNYKDSTIVYTLNPYTQYAPLPWNQVRFANNHSETKPTLYSLQYPEDLKKNYQSIYFDKTQYLDGHEITLLNLLDFQSSTQEYYQKEMNKYLIMLKNSQDLRLNTLSDYMNVTTTIKILKNYFNDKILKSGYDFKLFSHQYDAHNQMYQLADINYKFSDFVTQYLELDFSILTKKTDYLTATSEIKINFQLIFITVLVLLLILLVIIISNRFHVNEGMMNIVSMSLGMELISPIKCLSMRIIYFFGFLFIFIVMPEFQGQISAILSHPKRRNVESLKDLFDNKYHVFYDGTLNNDMIYEKLWVTEENLKYLHPSSSVQMMKCLIEAQQNSTIACISLSNTQLHYALQLKNVHLSKESVFKKYYVFWTKKNWALKPKIDKARSIPVEIGLIDHNDEDIRRESRKKIKKMKKINEAEEYERIDFENLVFYFITFAAIFLWSLVIFGIELIVYHNHSKYQRQEKERRQFIEKLRAQPRIIFFPGRIVLSNSRE